MRLDYTQNNTARRLKIAAVNMSWRWRSTHGLRLILVFVRVLHQTACAVGYCPPSRPATTRTRAAISVACIGMHLCAAPTDYGTETVTDFSNSRSIWIS
jgi:hypothetical protein